ncbi:hypothetical protein E2C01_059157 [Portunus trituberculatus]|uniref:Uncharacterized protein n=1 Tax=Portunus trituberculatus TaxID=210409 RepID=A0A5B7H4L9_PORTR|nr:hypothetical protein [Portunus trituberculatus]
MALTERRRNPDIVNLYMFQHYNTYIACRNRFGGDVAVFVSDDSHFTALHELRVIESHMDCISIECNNERKQLFLCIYWPPSGNIKDFHSRKMIFLLQQVIKKAIMIHMLLVTFI